MEERTWEKYPSEESSFVATPQNFVHKSARDLSYFKKYFPFISRDLVSNTEIIYEQHQIVATFKGAKVLVIGGGPSTRDHEWTEDGYDIVCSCNHFFRHPRVREITRFATLGNEVSLLDQGLNGLSTVFCFENTYRNVEFFYRKHFNNCMIASTRYMSKLGGIPRLLSMVVLWGAASVDVIGMDGYPPGTAHHGNSNHAFEKNKRMQGTYSYELYVRQYLELWDYLRRIGPTVSFKNLGFGHPYNISSLYLNDKGEWLNV